MHLCPIKGRYKIPGRENIDGDIYKSEEKKAEEERKKRWRPNPASVVVRERRLKKRGTEALKT